MSEPGPPRSLERIATALLAVAAASLAVAAVASWGWWRAARQPIDLERLSPESRQELAGRLLESSPGIHRWAFFEPRIGYTLRPGARLEAWGGEFRTNELGFRAPPAAKAQGTYRIVFVGDSWTFGMGVEAGEAFPARLAELAGRHAGLERRVEAWPLALPGWNLLNGLAALEYFLDRLEPDAVVLCPSGNDNHSTAAVLPNGSLAANLPLTDAFGDPHLVVYRGRRIASYRFAERWRRSFAEARRAEERLARRGVPLLLAFVARFEPVDAHSHVATAGLEAPYVVVPPELTLGRWENPPPHGHGTPAAHRRYARMVYRGLERLLGWPPLPADAEPEPAEVWGPPPAGEAWPARWTAIARRATAEAIPESFRPGPSARLQAAGPLDPETGLAGRATTILVRARPGARELEVAVRRLAEAPSLYPLGLAVTVPSPAGGSRVVTTVSAHGEVPHRFRVPIPPDLAPGVALDVVFEAERAAASPETPAPRSLYVVEIESVGVE